MPLRLARDYSKKAKEAKKPEKTQLVNPICLRCVEQCKQSDKVDILSCSNFKEKEENNAEQREQTISTRNRDDSPR